MGQKENIGEENISEKSISEKSISDDYFEFMLKRSLDAFVEEESLAQEKEYQQMENKDDIVFSKGYKKTMARLLRKRKYNWLTQKQVACAFLVLVISTVGIGYQAEGDLRFFVNHIFRQEETTLEILQSTTDVAYDFSSVPDAWEYFYIPEYLPKGYDVDEFVAQKHNILIYYTNGEDELVFSQANLVNNISLDTERLTWKDVDINGKDGVIATEGEHTILLWFDEEVVYTLQGNIAQEVLLEMAENMKIVNQ